MSSFAVDMAAARAAKCDAEAAAMAAIPEHLEWRFSTADDSGHVTEHWLKLNVICREGTRLTLRWCNGEVTTMALSFYQDQQERGNVRGAQ